MVSDLEINVKDYDYKSDKPLATGSTADVYLINYDGHEMVAKVLTLRMLSTVERVKKPREFKHEVTMVEYSRTRSSVVLAPILRLLHAQRGRIDVLPLDAELLPPLLVAVPLLLHLLHPPRHVANRSAS